MSEAESALIIERILSAVSYINSNGYVIRNLNPELIYYELDSSLYDFKIVDMLTMVSVVSLEIGEYKSTLGRVALGDEYKSDMEIFN